MGWLLAVCQLAAAQEVTILSHLDIARIRQVLDVAVDPSGDWIAFTVVEPADPLGDNRAAGSSLQVLETKSGVVRSFITVGPVAQIAFRPGHSSITFLSRRQGERTTSLYEISLGGGEAQKIFQHEASIAAYNWAPDGLKLAFIAPLRPESAKSALAYQPEIFEENLVCNKGYWVEMPKADINMLRIEGHVYDLTWSPDGRRLAAVVAPTPLVDHSYMRRRLLVLDPSNELAPAEVNHRAKFGKAEWSADSRSLAFIAGADLHDPIAGRLFVVPAEGGLPNRLYPEFKGKFEEVTWADAQNLRVVASEGVSKSILQIQFEGRRMRRIFESGSMNVSRLSAAANGDMVFVCNTPAHPSEVYFLNKDGKFAHRMSDSNPWLSERRLASQEVVSYRARDGLDLQGMLIRPLDGQPGKSYPLIAVVHGGPESHYSNGWLTGYNLPGQLAASRGYAVFYPNYRGSTGRGEEFAKLSQGDPAGSEFDDVVDGIDHLIATGLVDPEKVGVTGGSYGGYATAWMSTYYSSRFAAGVMSVGISNEISKWGTSDIPEEFYLVHARKQIWDDWDFFLKRSPIYYAGQAKTPLLILHGKNDTRVHPGQSLELYRHISARTDTPVRLVFYPGEGHGNRGAAARLDYNIRLMQWFDQFLMGESRGMPSPVPGPELLSPW